MLPPVAFEILSAVFQLGGEIRFRMRDNCASEIFTSSASHFAFRLFAFSHSEIVMQLKMP